MQSYLVSVATLQLQLLDSSLLPELLASAADEQKKRRTGLPFISASSFLKASSEQGKHQRPPHVKC